MQYAMSRLAALLLAALLALGVLPLRAAGLGQSGKPFSTMVFENFR